MSKKEQMITIKINEETAQALCKINDRYFFDLFREIRISEQEELDMRDAICSVVESIERYRERR